MNRLLAFSLVLLLAANALGQRITASLDRSTTSVGESVGLAINCENFQPRSIPRLQVIPGLRIASAAAEQKLQLANGKRTSFIIYNYLITPIKPGTYTLPSVSANANGRTLRTKPLKLNVLATGQNPPDDNGLSKYAFIRLIPGKTTAYVGEAIPVKIQLFLQNGRYNSPELTAEGFNFADFPKPSSSQAQKGNEIYQVRTFSTAATPVKAGSLQLGPVKLNVVLKIRQQQRRRSPFNDPFDGFFNRYQDVPFNLEAKAQSITVKPLPTASRPANFNGAVGQYTMQAKASPLKVTVGDPVTVNIRIDGQGPIESLNLPRLDWPGFKSYEPSISANTLDQLGIEGSKTFEQVVIPESDTIAEMPRIEFSFFDPVTSQYRVLAKGPFPLKVNPSSKPVAPVVGGNTAQETEDPDSPPQTDILTIKHHLGSLGQAMPLIARPNFWLLQSIPLLLWIAALAWRRKTNALANNPRLRRERQVAKRIRSGIAKLDALANDGEVGEFHAEMADLLRKQIGLQLDIPAEGITGDIVHSHAAQKRLNEDTRDDIRKLFTASDQASFAGSQTTGEMKANLALLKELFYALK